MRDKQTLKQKLKQFDRANVEAARLILADADKYPPGSALHRWAELVLKAASAA